MQMYWAAESLAAVRPKIGCVHNLLQARRSVRLITSYYTVMGNAPAFALGKLTNALHPCKTRSCNATLRLRPFVKTEAELVVEIERRGISIEKQQAARICLTLIPYL